MSRWERKQSQKLSNYYGTRRDESGNGECFADTYQRTMGMAEDAAPARAAVPALTPLQRSIAECEAQIAATEAKSWLSAGDKANLVFYRELLAAKLAEQG